ncbi:MAG: sel1 repeat family protein [Planctomycetes bacterium]|nr:sel1 repeat family protein [Planctomycetota bacterium]
MKSVKLNMLCYFLLLFLYGSLPLIHAVESVEAADDAELADQIYRSLENMDGRSAKVYLPQAISLGSLKAGLRMMENGDWGVASNLLPLESPIQDWKDSEELVDGMVPASIIYAEILANWATRQRWMKQKEKNKHMRDAALIMQEHGHAHPIAMNEYLWLWNKVHPNMKTSDQDYIDYCTETEKSLLAHLAARKMSDRLGAVLSLGEFYIRDRLNASYVQKAQQYFEEAAVLGDAYGQYIFGLNHINGTWDNADKEQGFEMLRNAALQGYDSASSELYRKGQQEKEYAHEYIDFTLRKKSDAMGESEVYAHIRASGGTYSLKCRQQGVSQEFPLSREAYVSMSNKVKEILLELEDQDGNTDGTYSFSLSCTNSEKNYKKRVRLSLDSLNSNINNIAKLILEFNDKIEAVPTMVFDKREFLSFTCHWSLRGTNSLYGNIHRDGENGVPYSYMRNGKQVAGKGMSRKYLSQTHVKLLQLGIQEIFAYAQSKDSFLLGDRSARECEFSVYYDCGYGGRKSHSVRFSAKHIDDAPMEIKVFLKIVELLHKSYDVK